MQHVSNEVRIEFMGWLASTYNGNFGYAVGNFHTIIIRVCKNEDFDYLYAQRQYQSSEIERRSNFEYAGMYCKRDRRLYDVQYEIRGLADDKVRSVEALKADLKQAVRRAVEERINNDRRNLQITELSTERKINDLAYYIEHTAWRDAREAYLHDEHDTGFSFSFQCCYRPNAWTEDSLLTYILDPVQYVTVEAEKYISSHQENILSAFLEADMAAAEYAAILGNPQHQTHTVKRIMAAVKASAAKMVTVTIHKDDIDFTFKAEAHQFRQDCTAWYGAWYIAAADRREFERIFGRNADYRPEHITRITYARKTLYQT